MKPWEQDRARVAAIRAEIALRWREDTDMIIASQFGVSRRYVEKLRQRMGIVKSYVQMKTIREFNPRAKKLRRTSVDSVS